MEYLILVIIERWLIIGKMGGIVKEFFGGGKIKFKSNNAFRSYSISNF